MLLYHGTNQDITEINLTAGLKHKDFGQGFYLTPNLLTAERMAKKKAKFNGGSPTVISYEYDEHCESSNLKIKHFPEQATAEWIRFISQNRDRNASHVPHNYDIVIGPIADDGVVLQLSNYRDEILTPEEAAKRLQDKYMDQQYYFGTEAALKQLRKIKAWQIN